MENTFVIHVAFTWMQKEKNYTVILFRCSGGSIYLKLMIIDEESRFH